MLSSGPAKSLVVMVTVAFKLVTAGDVYKNWGEPDFSCRFI